MCIRLGLVYLALFAVIVHVQCSENGMRNEELSVSPYAIVPEVQCC